MSSRPHRWAPHRSTIASAFAIMGGLAVFVTVGGACRRPAGQGSQPADSPAAVKVQVARALQPPMYKPSSRSPAPMSIIDPDYGAYANAPDAPGLGVTVPDFVVPLADGGVFSLADARRAGPVLVMFYRGFW